MSPEKELELVSIYPQIFEDGSETACITLFGFECGDGWFHLLKDLIYEIRAICEAPGFQSEGICLIPAVEQVKEKYGTLRFYMSYTTEAVFEAIERAEERSKETCEICGEPGTLESVTGWYMVRCPKCLPACA